jgi:squalene synthase HpnC
VIHPTRAHRATSTVPLPRTGPSGRAELDDCYAYCEQIARAHHENFPVASAFLPQNLRKHVLALYAFIRVADDIADEPEFEGKRAEMLDDWEDQLERAWHGDAQHPVLVALADTQQRRDLPITPLMDLLSAFRMDLIVRRYATFGDLRAYLDLAAAPIGKAMLYLFGVRDPDQHAAATALASALAMTNFWQDIAADLARDRLYLPLEDLRHFGVREEDLAQHADSAELAALVRFQCARTRAELARARPLVDRVPSHLGVEVALMWHGGRIALDKVEAHADDVFGPPVHLSTFDKARALAHALRERGSGLFRRFA